MLTLLALLSGTAEAQSFADLVKTHALTASDEHKIGASYIELSGWLYGQVDDVEMVRRVEHITRKVVAASDRPDLVVNVIVADSEEVNAAAYPGGYLVVNRGAVELFEDDELTFVIAHEISHVLLRHYATTENLRLATEKLSLAETAMAGSDREEGRAAAEELAKMMATYGRQLEFEADLYGLLYSARAGVPMDSGQRAMAKLAEVSGPIPSEYEAFVNHPSFPDRVSELKNGVDTLQSVRRKFDLGLSALSAGMDETAVESFQEFLTLFPRSVSGWTNLAAAHLRQGLTATNDPWLDRVPIRVRNDVTLRAASDLHMDRAKDACSKALAIDPNSSECWTMLGVMARHAGQPMQARSMLIRAQMSAKEPSATISVDLGVVEGSGGNFDGARDYFKQALKLEPNDPYAKANLATLWELKGKPEAAVEIWSELLAEGQLPGAATKALKRLGARAGKRPKKPEPVTLGKLHIGITGEAAVAMLGKPDLEDGDEIGLTVYRAWTDKGVNGIFAAGSAMGLECWGPCKLDLRGVRTGDAWESVEAKLGPPSEQTGDALFGVGRTAYYAPMGVTVYEFQGKVSRIAVWAP